ncbi:MAG: nucleotidyltransferase family protein [Clostridia bacterium]|nr:nucleotidyltransferase family protein [Clostridia bacterium]
MPESVSSNRKEIAAYVINLVAAAVNSAKAPEKPENISWQDIIKFAKEQSVLNLVSYACETLTTKPTGDTLKFLREFRKQKIVIEAEQEIIAGDVFDMLEAKGIKHMPLKGYIVKNYYPSPDMRTMSDIDVLLEPNKIEEAVKLCVDDGFKFSSDGDLHCNIEKGKAHFEFHRALVNTSYKNLTAYYGDGFVHAKKADGYNCRYEMSDEDVYVFLLAHLAKHYRYGGTGIRTVLDLYVFRKALPSLDMTYILNETAKIGLDKFQKTAEQVADEWFGGTFNGEFNSVSAYIISGGVYGTKDLYVVNNMINSNDNMAVGKIKSIFSMIFPSYALMSEWFPILKKVKILLPLFWVIRWVKSLAGKNSNLKNTLRISSEIINTDDSIIAAQRDAGLGEL